MIFSKTSLLSAAMGSALMFSMAAPVSAAPMSVAPASTVSLPSAATDVAYRGHRARHVVRNHGRRTVRHRRYYRRHSAFPAAAFGLFAAGIGSAIAANNYYDDGYYYGGYAPAYSYGYGYPAYGYGYGGGRHWRGGQGYAGRGVVYNRPGGFRGGFHGMRGGGRAAFAGGGRGGFGGRHH